MCYFSTGCHRVPRVCVLSSAGDLTHELFLSGWKETYRLLALCGTYLRLPINFLQHHILQGMLRIGMFFFFFKYQQCLDPNLALYILHRTESWGPKKWMVCYVSVNVKIKTAIFTIFSSNSKILLRSQSCVRHSRSSTKTKMGLSAVKTWGTAWELWAICQQRWSW